MKNQIKELRVKIDGLAQLTKELREPYSKELKFFFNSAECNKAYNSLILAKAWLGKILEELGEKSPYSKDGIRKTVEDIEPTADKASKVEDFPIDNKNWKDKINEVSHIEKVDWIREKIKETVKKIRSLQIMDYNIELRYWSNSLSNLDEARFWLGFELQRIKENEERKSS